MDSKKESKSIRIIKRTKKKEVRQTQFETKQKQKKDIKYYEKKFRDFSLVKLKNIVRELIIKGDSIDKVDPLNIDLEVQLDAIKRITENKHKVEDFNSGLFSYYPDLLDPDFNKKIFHKKEFYENMIKLTNYNLNDLSSERCNPNKWNLLPNQVFLKNFISLETPYNGVLLWHGTGVGKTCSAITIAEQFKDTIKRDGKKIFVLLSPSIKDNFKKQIFNVDKLGKFKIQKLSDIKTKTIAQCTGNSYLKELEDMILEDKEQFSKKINRVINSHYNFMGYDSFANYVTKLEEECIKGYDVSMKHYLQKKMRKKMFSDTIFIIDEAHHIRITDDNSNKIAPPVIERVIKDADNVKLILLTATPMYNNQTEIVWLLNLLLQNDNRPWIDNNDIFDSKGELKSTGLEILKEKSTGYISYLRGENPYSFPLRLYPTINQDPKLLYSENTPKFNMDGTQILKKHELKYLKLVNSNMSELQYKIYRKSVESLMKIGQDYEEPLEDQDYENTFKKDSGYSDIEKGLQTSNFVFPSNDETIELNNYYGLKGLERCFDVVVTKGGKKYKYNNNIYKQFGNFLHCPRIDEEVFIKYQLSYFSSKMDSIMKYIYNSKGIVYIYSQFINSGVLPFALALEQNGFKKYGKEQLLDHPEYVKSKTNCKSEPISFEGKRISEYKSKKDFIQANYVIITGNDMISKNNDQEINDTTLENNKFGEKIKVILGSPIAGEGLDMKRLREIHVLDPWHHLNRIEQVIGRGIRNCSHSDLDLKDRNCTIFMHVASSCTEGDYADELERETIDLRIYRKAEHKSIKMGIIEKELKKNAIDCSLNKQGNVYSQELWNQNIDIETSQRLNTSYRIGDQPYSKICNFQEDCDYECDSKTKQELEKRDIDNDTYNLNFSKQYIYKILEIIKEMFSKDYIFDLKDIFDYVIARDDSIESIYVYNALEMLVNDQTQYVFDKFNRTGKVIYKGGYYIFQPIDIIDENIPMYYRNQYLDIKKKRVSLKNNYHFQNLENMTTLLKKTIKIKKKDSLHIIKQIITNVNNGFKKIKGDDFLSSIDDLMIKKILYHKNIDRLNHENKSIIIEYIIHKLKFNKSDISSKLIVESDFLLFESLLNYFLFEDRDIKIGKKSSTIVGYRVFINNSETLFIYKDGEFKLCPIQNQEKYKKMIDISKETKIRKESVINGYIEKSNDRENIYNFKLVDKSTTNTTKSRKATGAVCSDINSKDSIGNLINIVSGNRKYENKNIQNYGEKQYYTKEQLCSYLEIVLRYREIIKYKDLKWFFRTNEKNIF